MAENRSAQQVREITDKLEQGIKELFESERFKEYLRTMSKFYNYSFNNTLLIAMQKPEATYPYLTEGFCRRTKDMVHSCVNRDRQFSPKVVRRKTAVSKE